MFEKTITELQRISRWYRNDPGIEPSYCSELIYYYNTAKFSLQSFENKIETCIDIHNYVKNTNIPTTPFITKQFQIYVGNHLVFCSERELHNLPPDDKYFIIMYNRIFVLYQELKAHINNYY